MKSPFPNLLTLRRQFLRDVDAKMLYERVSVGEFVSSSWFVARRLAR